MATMTLPEINYAEHSGIDDKALEASSLLGIPEIQAVIGFYKYEITKLTSDKSLNPFIVKLKTDKLRNEYAVLSRTLKDINTRMQLLDKDPENPRWQAELSKSSLMLAEMCQYLMQKNHITNQRPLNTVVSDNS